VPGLLQICCEIPGDLGCPGTGRMIGDAQQMGPAAANLDDDRRVQPFQHHGVDVRAPDLVNFTLPFRLAVTARVSNSDRTRVTDRWRTGCWQGQVPREFPGRPALDGCGWSAERARHLVER